jgi:metal-responsive CopG/Arc/MetJ family transcriptional regulator
MINIPGEIKNALDEAVRSEGISSNELVGRALKQYLFLRRFRLLGDRMTAEAQKQGIQTEQDVFDRVS